MTETDNTRREHRSIYLNDINAVLPEGKRNYFSFVTYEDYSDLPSHRSSPIIVTMRGNKCSLSRRKSSMKSIQSPFKNV